MPTLTEDYFCDSKFIFNNSKIKTIMCLSVPAQVIKIEGDTAEVSVGGTLLSANLSLVDDVVVGDYILLHTGFALQIIDAEEAAATLETFNEFRELNEALDDEEKISGERIV
jgi:hydrogenase expression/formation protein HypC